MCRVMLYLGSQEVAPYDFLFSPDNSLTRQSYDPKLMSHIQNLAGFGMVGWEYSSDNSEIPFFYKTEKLPFFDNNLLNLSKKIKVNCLLSHVRGVDYDTNEIVVRENTHPFFFEGYKVALAHNGNLEDMYRMKPELLKYVKPELAKNILGTTDSEWIYALFLSLLKNPKEKIEREEAKIALIKTLKVLRKVREKLKIETTSPVNLFITNGEFIIVTRFVYDYGWSASNAKKGHLAYHSLWFTFGEVYGFFDGTFKMKGSKKRNNIIFSSEPLTEDRTTWIEVPEYSIVTSWFDENQEIKFSTEDLTV